MTQQVQNSSLQGYVPNHLVTETPEGKIRTLRSQVVLKSVRTQAEAEAYAAEFVENHHLPSPCSIQLDPSGNVILRFDLAAIDQFSLPPQRDFFVSDLEIVLTPDGSGYALVEQYYPWYGDDNHYDTRYSLEEIGVQL